MNQKKNSLLFAIRNKEKKRKMNNFGFLEDDELREINRRNRENTLAMVDVSSTNLKKEDLSDEFLVYVSNLNKKLNGKLTNVMLYKNFNEKTLEGITYFMRHDTPLIPNIGQLFKDGVLGKVLCSYELLTTNPKGPKEEEYKRLSSMFRNHEKGPSLAHLDVSGKDEKKWYPVIEEGNKVVLSYIEEEKKIILTVLTTLRKSSDEINKMVNEFIKKNDENNQPSYMIDLVADGGMLNPLYKKHLRLAKRNNRKVAWEITRFLNVRIPHIKDKNAIYENSWDPKQYLGKEYLSQYLNTVEYHGGVSPEASYMYYMSMMEDQNATKYSFEKGFGNQGTVVLYSGVYPFRFYRDEVKYKKKKWMMLAELDYDKMDFITMIDFNLDEMAAPMVIPPKFEYKPMEELESKEDMPMMEKKIGSTLNSKKPSTVQNDSFFSKLENMRKFNKTLENTKLKETKINAEKQKLYNNYQKVYIGKEIKISSVPMALETKKFFNRDLCSRAIGSNINGNSKYGISFFKPILVINFGK